MSYSENDNVLVEELLRSIQSTTSLIQSLMKEIKDNASALATLEVKLESLSESAKTLSKIVRDDNGNKSILTRIALAENDLTDLYTNYKEFKVHVYKKLEEMKDETSKVRNEITKSADEIKEEVKLLGAKEEQKESFNKSKMLATLQIAPGVIALVLVLIKLLWGVDIGL